AAIAQAVYAPEAYSPSDVVCTTTLHAFDALIAKEADVIFVLAPSAEQRAKAEAAGVELHFTPIGREAFVFLVGQTNPLDNLATQQIRNVYSGKTAQWATLGWEDGGKIIAYQRVENSGSQSGLQRMVMTGLPIQAPQPLPKGLPKGSSSMMQQVSVSWQGVQPALGFSYRFFATTMFPNPDAKLLQVDGVAPTVANIQNGSYPFIADFYAVTNGPPQGNTKVLIDWITSPPGQAIVAQAGYTPLTN
ncbi:MAG: substrate-binding domain-containing protein, partial [Propionibacteriaceae bacterium]|nr:substrate-binding domain-containing protein [Propionibacteriaceae bacterium]